MTLSKNFEVEIRSFLTKKEYLCLLSFFKNNGQFIKKDLEETYYLESKHDLRIQKNKNFSKIWLKKGKLHDDIREEIEINFTKKDFEKIKQLFLILGFKTKIKWIRKRQIFLWKKIKICLDETQGYGYILELEKIADTENKNKVLKTLNARLKELKIKKNSKKEFSQKFKNYEKNWKKLI